MFRYLFLISLFLVIFTSCNTILEKKNSNYNSILDKYSKSDYKYKDLFDGKLTLEVVFISNDIKNALKKDIKSNNLRKKNIPFPIDNDYPSFLVAFYHYDYKANNLDREETSWDISLKLKNKTYKPSKVTKLFKSNHKVFKTYFNNEQRFSTFYLVEFKNLKLDKLSGNISLVLSSIDAALKAVWRL